MRILLTGNRMDVWFLSSYLRRQRNIQVATISYYDLKDLKLKIKELTRANIVTVISIRPAGWEGLVWTFIFISLRLLGKKITLHWQGTDVVELRKPNSLLYSRIVSFHTAQAPWLCCELKQKGINATWFPIVPPLRNSKLLPMPRKFAVLTYVASGKADFYGHGVLRGLSKALQDVDFYVVGSVHKRDQIREHNIKYLGWVKKMEEVYSKTTVLLRLTEHDGLSFMALEALARGRHVIWNKRFPHCHFAESEEQALQVLRRLKSGSSRMPNIAGAKFVRKQFSEKVCVRKIVGVYNALT